MDDNQTRWWMLQVQFQERYPGQLNLLSQPFPRDELLRKCFELIPTSIRTAKGVNLWGLAELVHVSHNIMLADLTVRPPQSNIAEEPEPGVLEETLEPRFFAPIVVHIPLQIIAVNRGTDVSRFARSAKAFAAIFYDLISKAMQILDMSQHYVLDVEPIAKTGSFVQWYKSLDKLDRIAVHYVGLNLPSSPGSLVQSIRETAHSFRDTLRSATVDLIANEPQLVESDVEELDQAVSDRRLRIRAKGTRSGIGTNWSSSDRPEPETIQVPLTQEEITDSSSISTKIAGYLEDYLGEGMK